MGIGTALFYDPLICPKINQGILAYLDRHEIPSVQELDGDLAPERAAGPTRRDSLRLLNLSLTGEENRLEKNGAPVLY